MKLKEYLYKHKDVKKILNFTRQRIYNYETHKSCPNGVKTFQKLFFATNRAVEPNDFFPLNEWKQELKELKTKKVDSNVRKS